MSRMLAIRADAGVEIGTGHVMRMIALAQAWAERGGRAVFIGRIQAAGLDARVRSEGFGVVEISRPHPHPDDLKALLTVTRPGDWVALDGYHFDTAYMRAVRAAGRRLLVVDDTCDRGEYDADIYLNQNLGAEALRPELAREAARHIGPRYALLRREFLATRQVGKSCPARARNILVTFGGADQGNATGQALDALALLDNPALHVRVVVGAANPHAQALRAQAEALRCHCELLQPVGDMPGLMAWADLAVSAAGSTCWELCYFGVPMLLAPIADNQAGIAPALASAGAALAVRPEAGALAQGLRSLVGDAAARGRMSPAGQELVDGLGAARVARLMAAPAVTLRPAAASDAVLLLAWRNSPSVVRNCFSADPVEADEHAKWLGGVLVDPNRLLCIAVDEQESPVGQIRFDWNDGAAALSISVAPGRQGLGIGPSMVLQGCALAWQKWPGASIRAEVKPGNEPSAVMFAVAGFVPIHQADEYRLVFERKEDRSGD